MIFTDYYRFDRIASKAKTRLDCTLSTHSYEPLEKERKRKAMNCTPKRDGVSIGALTISYLTPYYVDANKHRTSDKSIVAGDGHVSGIFNYDDNYSFGDYVHTSDGILFIDSVVETSDGIQSGTLEMFIARGQKKHIKTLMMDVVDGGKDEEIEALRKMATAESPTIPSKEDDLPK